MEDRDRRGSLVPAWCLSPALNLTIIKFMTAETQAKQPSLPPLAPGTLYLVATPIGNLEDITLRALRTLRECDAVAAEDTRHTGQLLHRFEISKPMLSCFQFNEARRAEEILQRLRQGQKISLVTDAGSPGISDPGERIVRAVISAGFRVEPVPGPSALVAAITASGLPTDEFHFVGFLPHKSGQRRRRLAELSGIPGTLVLYESPYRVMKLLGEMEEPFSQRQVVLAREITKKFEEFLRGRPAELMQALAGRSLKGEFVVLVSGPEYPASAPAEDSSKCQALQQGPGEAAS
jgi:16S rRNA (cytidine1402-2'-O)-methyltransferase